MRIIHLLSLLFMQHLFAYEWALKESPQLPQYLHSTGIYSSKSGLKISKELYPFKPQYPLWTDGAIKIRYAYVPANSQIDSSDMNDWKFPVGTIFWKEFNFKQRKVETRVIALTAKGWLFGSYQWNETQTSAILASEQGAKNVAPIGHYKFGKELKHHIPSKLQCKACHDLGRSMILGFDALQLSDDKDPLANQWDIPSTHITSFNVSSLVKNNLLSHPPAKAERINSNSDLERSALGYLHGNCGNCHRPTGAAQHTKLFFRHEMGSQSEATIETAVHQKTFNYTLPGIAKTNTYRILPGSPALSAVWFRMNSRHAKHQMPKIGSQVVDTQGSNLIFDWILSLGDKTYL